MKMCEICGKHPATIFIKTNINGVKTEKQVCAECAKMMQDSTGFADILGGFMSFGNMFSTPSPHTMRVCPKCGMSEREVLDQSRFGCNECYETFGDLVDSFVGNLGGKTYGGEGKVEKSAKQKPKSKLEILKEELDKAVEEKDFLKANDIHNQILALKKGE
ncbi:MAG: UvrB/UvrC motif-containing protein [Christensenellales bacterium]